MSLFSLHCTTCRRRLKVTDPAAIGAILACPGCGSMVQIVPPEGWQAGGTGEASAASPISAPKSALPPPLVRVRIASPELTSEAVEAAVAGGGPSPAGGPSPVGGPAAATGASKATPSGISPKTLWLGAGAVGIAVVSALIAVLIGATSKESRVEPVGTVAESKDANSPPKSPPVAPPPAAEKLPAPSVAPALAVAPATPTVENKAVEGPPAEKPPLEKPAVEKSVESPAVSPASSEAKVAASAEKPAPPPAEPPLAKAFPIVDKPDLDEDLDPVERSSSFAIRRGREAIDWPSRLSQPIAGLDCRDLPLADYAKMLSDVGNAPISLDVDALVELGVSPAAPVTVRLSNATLSTALEGGLSPRGLRAVVEGNHLLITRAGDKTSTLQSVPYGVADLAPSAAALGELGDMIRALIAPDSWKDAGGMGGMRMAEGSLVVEQTPAVHYQIVTLCEKLRVARGLPTKSKLDPAIFRLDSRTDRAKDLLARPVPAAFFRNLPLPKILDYLAKKTKTRLLVDVRAMEFDGMPLDIAGTIAVQGQPLAAALTSMLEPLHLSYRVVDEQTLQITTQRGFRRELEFYRVADLLASGIRPEQIMERIAKEVAPDRWAIAGGKGAMHFDRASGCLLVTHSQLVQRDVQAFLVNWRQSTLTAKLPSPAK